MSNSSSPSSGHAHRPVVVAAVVFVLTAVAFFLLILELEERRVQTARSQLEGRAAAYARTVEQRLNRALSAVYALAATVRQNQGKLESFDALARQLLPYYPGIAELQLAPGGITRRIVPASPNHAGIGRDLLRDPTRAREALLARDTRQLVLAGPFNLIQGGIGAVGRFPIFLDDGSANGSFWGFVSVVIRLPEAIEPSELEQLAKEGFAYQLWRTHPDTGQPQIIAASTAGELDDPVTHRIALANAAWTLTVAPTRGWHRAEDLLVAAIFALLFSSLLAYAAKLLCELKAHRKHLTTLVLERTGETLATRDQLRSTLGAIPDLLCELSLDGRYHAFHAPEGCVLARPTQEVVGTNVSEHLGEEAAAVVTAALREAYARGRSQGAEFSQVVGGTTFWFELSVARKAAAPGQSAHFIVLARDITERKLQEERAARLLTENETILRNAMVGLIYLKQGRIMTCNRRVAEILGYEPGELVGQPSRRLSGTPHDFDAVDGEAQPILSAGGSYTHELLLRRKGGDQFWGAITGSAIDPARVQDGSIWILADITERKHAKEALLRLNEELEARVVQRTEQLLAAKEEAERANLSKSEFLSSMSHELRTPLNAILGFSQLLRADPVAPPTPDQAESLDEILRAGNHLLALINEVLDLARIESGRLELSPEPVELAALFQECLSLVRPLAEPRRVRLACDAPEGFTLRIDRLRLRQLILNLLSNAIKYNRDGGQVRLECHPGEDLVQIAVHDSGIGIAPDFLPRLFKPFERHGASSRRVEGTGIGLALCKRLLEAMGGTISVESAPGRGSVFRVSVPNTAAPASPAALPPAMAVPGLVRAPMPAAARRTLLYVEDNLANLRLVQKILAQLPGLRLIDAATAATGLALARACTPDLILMDIGLPDMSGLEALQRLRRDPALARTPVVALSANAMPADIEAARLAGFDDYLTKPIDVARFRTIVETLVTDTSVA